LHQVGTSSLLIVVNYNVQFIFRSTECANIKLPSLHTFIMCGT